MSDEDIPGDINHLLDSIKSKDSKLRAKASELLGYQNDARAVEPLINALNDQTVRVRVNAATALGHLRDPKSVQALIQALDDDNERVRAAAVNSLVEFGQSVLPVIETLFKQQPTASRQARYQAVHVLGRIPGSNSDVILRRVLNIERLNPPLIGLVTDFLLSHSASDPLTILVKEYEKEQIRLAAAYKLRGNGEEKVIKGLLSVIENNATPPMIKVACIQNLGQLGERQAVDPLIKALDDLNSSVRETAAYALGMIKDVKAIEPLGKALRDQFCFEKVEIQRAGAQIMDEWIFTVYPVRKAAAEALRVIGTPETARILEQNKEYL